MSRPFSANLINSMERAAKTCRDEYVVTSNFTVIVPLEHDFSVNFKLPDKIEIEMCSKQQKITTKKLQMTKAKKPFC